MTAVFMGDRKRQRFWNTGVMTQECTASVHQEDKHNEGATELSLTKHNNFPTSLCTEALRLVHCSGNHFLRTTKEKKISRWFFLWISWEVEDFTHGSEKKKGGREGGKEGERERERSRDTWDTLALWTCHIGMEKGWRQRPGESTGTRSWFVLLEDYFYGYRELGYRDRKERGMGGNLHSSFPPPMAYMEMFSP